MTATTIRELFDQPVDRPIDGVIKADDERNLLVEINEYVVTRDVMKGLGAFVDCYLDNPTANGTWISGFYGCGKSHLLKMLSLILDSEKRVGDGIRPADLLLPKVDDEITRAGLRKATNIPARSLLFNIDQKYDGIGGDHKAPILEVFMKVLNELQGYYGNQAYIARFEHELDKRGHFEPFKQTYLRLIGCSWEDDRDAVDTVTKPDFARAYAEHFGVSQADAIRVIDDANDNYRLSIEGFAARVKEYLDSQPAGFRLNFFVDEAGQFIGQDRSRLLNLQTVVESLGSATNGRASVFITSQADLEGILGAFKSGQGEDISKIQARFRTKLTLASADVQEVIQRRLLAKSPEEPEELIAIYGREKENFQTLFRFGEGIQLKGWADCQSFCGLYPFHPYQLDLFQRAIEGLSKHQVFEGKYMSVGERSMLSVFQEVAKAIKDLPVGRLASFDQLYDGIRDVIRGDKQQVMVLAINQLGAGSLEVRILKALFLLKWVNQFRATPRNIAILLIDAPDVDIPSHEQAVKDALLRLESQSYLQPNGGVYEYLTDKEKDVEQDIKATEVDESQVMSFLQGTVFNDILKTNKIRFEDNNQDYPYAQKIDDGLIKGKDTDVAVNLITPEHPNYGSESILSNRNMGGAELMAILPAQGRLGDLIRTYLKTDKYIKQNTGGEDEGLQEILRIRGLQNSQRRSEITSLTSDLLRKAPLFVSGNRLEVGEGDPQNRFSKAYQELIRSAFPSLRMVRKAYNEGTLLKALQDQDDILEGSDLELSEAEQELFNEIRRRRKLEGDRLMVSDLVTRFEQRGYGWPAWATLTFLARLFKLGKLELWQQSTPLAGHEVVDALTNTRQWSGVEVRLQEVVDPQAIQDLKRFHNDFFLTPSTGTDARTTCKALKAALLAEATTLEGITAQKDRYPFLSALAPIATQLRELSGKIDNYLLTHQSEFTPGLLAALDETLTPIKAFMNGPQKTAYDKVLSFLSRHRDDLHGFPTEPVTALEHLEASSTPYQGTVVPEASAAVATLEALLKDQLKAARQEALNQLDSQEAKLKAAADFQQLDPAQQVEVLQATDRARKEIQQGDGVSRIQMRVQRYASQEYAKQLERTAALAHPSNEATKQITVVPASNLKIQCSLAQITNPEELKQWLEALRVAAQAELDQDHRISL